MTVWYNVPMPKAKVVLEEKPCTKCGQIKLASGFNKNKRTRDGLETQCKVCRYQTISAWEKRNRPARNARNTKSRQADPKRWRQYNACYQASYRAKQFGVAVNDFSVEDWQELLELCEGRCIYCGAASDALEPDHVTPLVLGGNNTKSNIVPSCPSCNAKKYKRTPDEAGMEFVIHIPA